MPRAKKPQSAPLRKQIIGDLCIEEHDARTWPVAQGHLNQYMAQEAIAELTLKMFEVYLASGDGKQKILKFVEGKRQVSALSRQFQEWGFSGSERTLRSYAAKAIDEFKIWLKAREDSVRKK